MKNLFFGIFCFNLLGCQIFQGRSNLGEPNFLIVDSSYAPLHVEGLDIPPHRCYLIDENNGPVEYMGSCYDEDSWKDVGALDSKLLKGYLDTNARRNTEEAKYWRLRKNQKDIEPTRVKTVLKLVTHGSRSLFLAHQASQGRIHPILIRSVTTQEGKIASDLRKCQLNKWSDEEVLEFEAGKLQKYQQKISKILKDNPGIKVVSLSLGYKKSWIKQDHPACDLVWVEKEYKILVSSWKNLLNQFPRVQFVVAAGNEGENFRKKRVRDNDLWAKLSDHKNLVLVGALDLKGRRMKQSNYGLKKMAWTQGSDLPIRYPYPKLKEGYPSMVHGTSAAAAVMAGKILLQMQ